MHSTWFKSTFLGLLQFQKIKEWGPNFLGGTNSAERLNYSILPLLYFNFKNFKDPNSSSFIRFQCVLHNSDVLFSDFWNFEKLNNGDLISWGEPVLQNGWIICFPHLYFNFKSFNDPNSLSFIRFQCVLQDSDVLFKDFWNFEKLNRRDVISWGEPILLHCWIIWSPLLYFNIKSFKDPTSSSFLRFQCSMHDSGVLFSYFYNFRKLKRGDLVSWGN